MMDKKDVSAPWHDALLFLLDVMHEAVPLDTWPPPVQRALQNASPTFDGEAFVAKRLTGLLVDSVLEIAADVARLPRDDVDAVAALSAIFGKIRIHALVMYPDVRFPLSPADVTSLLHVTREVILRIAPLSRCHYRGAPAQQILQPLFLIRCAMLWCALARAAAVARVRRRMRFHDAFAQVARLSAEIHRDDAKVARDAVARGSCLRRVAAVQSTRDAFGPRSASAPPIANRDL